MAPAAEISPKFAKQLVLDELFDLTLYRLFATRATGEYLRGVFTEIIPIEEKHFRFWQDFFGIKAERLDLSRRVKFWIIRLATKIFRDPAIFLVLEAIEVYGVRKYLTLWNEHKGTPFGGAVREILDDELRHEDAIVSSVRGRAINPERVRSIFLGFNDGLVEMLGAVSGFFAAFRDASAVVVAGLTVAVAGAISMAAGVYASSGSEREIERVESDKRKFLNGYTVGAAEDKRGERPAFLAVLVGISYALGALVPILPVLFGSRTVLISILLAGAMIIFVSVTVAFLSGMEAGRRIATNIAAITAAVGITYAIGIFVKNFFGIVV